MGVEGVRQEIEIETMNVVFVNGEKANQRSSDEESLYHDHAQPHRRFSEGQ